MRRTHGTIGTLKIGQWGYVEPSALLMVFGEPVLDMAADLVGSPVEQDAPRLMVLCCGDDGFMVQDLSTDEEYRVSVL